MKGGDIKKYLIKLLEIISPPSISVNINVTVNNSNIYEDKQ